MDDASLTIRERHGPREDNPMHLVQWLTHSSFGGAQSAVWTLLGSLRRLHPDLRMTVVLPAGGVFVQRFQMLGVQVVELPLNRISLRTWIRTIRVCRSFTQGVHHSHGKGAGLYLRLMSRRSFRGRRIHSYHGFHPPSGRTLRGMYEALESRLLRHIDGVIAVSSSEQEEIAARFPGVEEGLHLIPNVVDCGAVRRSVAEGAGGEVERMVNAMAPAFVVVMVARKDPVKNHPLAFRAAAEFLAGNNNAAVVFVGIDPLDRDITALRSAYPGNVLATPFLNGPSSLLSRSDVLLLTSRKEGSPLAVLEAFCLGKPVVGTDVAGIRDLVRHRRNGLLCEENPGAIAGALRELASDPSLYATLSRNALEDGRAMKVDAWAERYLEVYMSLAG